MGAKKHGFETSGFARRIRTRFTQKYYRTRTRKTNNQTLGIVDDVIMLGRSRAWRTRRFEKLGEKNLAFVPTRA